MVRIQLFQRQMTVKCPMRCYFHFHFHYRLIANSSLPSASQSVLYPTMVSISHPEDIFYASRLMQQRLTTPNILHKRECALPKTRRPAPEITLATRPSSLGRNDSGVAEALIAGHGRRFGEQHTTGTGREKLHAEDGAQHCAYEPLRVRVAGKSHLRLSETTQCIC